MKKELKPSRIIRIHINQKWPVVTGEMIVGQKESIPSVGSQDPINERK